MSKAASKDALEALHCKLAEKFKDLIEEVDSETKGGAALLSAARQFLKDNNIEAVVTPGSPLGALAERVSEFPFDPAESARH